ncbi:hypothetical protein AMTRI_Chr09g22200 [Amborella trichopoda]
MATQEHHSHPSRLTHFELDAPASKVPRTNCGGEEETVRLGHGLGLGLGLGTGRYCFTFLQLQELEQQALIFKYMNAGLPVPLQLVFPIWKSIVGSPKAIYCPPIFGGGLCFEYRNRMNPEPEPGRCRRTDGKKWRCSRDVVPDHKYCDRHIHRGRSRKPVEHQTINNTLTLSTQEGTQFQAQSQPTEPMKGSGHRLSFSFGPVAPTGTQAVSENSNGGASKVDSCGI